MTHHACLQHLSEATYSCACDKENGALNNIFNVSLDLHRCLYDCCHQLYCFTDVSDAKACLKLYARGMRLMWSAFE